MRKYIKNEIIGILQTLLKAHRSIKALVKAGDVQNLGTLLQDCQDAAITVGNMIEESEGEGTEAVKALEDYCEILYLFTQGQETAVNKLDACVNKCNQELYTFHETKEVVFLPYKASMWDSLESVWKKADADPDINAIVIPIPYYDKNPDGSFKEVHYERDEYPADVPTVHYDDYNFEARHPDEIYIHNPYDEYNYVTSVHPFFYCPHLREMTDKLIYIPYFVLAEARPDDPNYLKSIEHFVTVPGVLWADEVWVQSPAMAEAYVNIALDWFKDSDNKEMQSRKMWEAKIKGIGSPKIEKIKSLRDEDTNIPDEWLKLILRPDGSRRKIILYNTSVGALIKNGEEMVDKIKRVLDTFYENREDVILWWRPHPLIQATIESMHPKLWEEYKVIVDKYIADGWGIYDDTADMDRALAVSDAYFGDPSSLVQLYQELKKPIMIQNVDV